MPDKPKEEVKKVGILGKVKEAILPDAEEQAAIISTAVRITVLAWSGAILTLNYVAILVFLSRKLIQLSCSVSKVLVLGSKRSSKKEMEQ